MNNKEYSDLRMSLYCLHDLMLNRFDSCPKERVFVDDNENEVKLPTEVREYILDSLWWRFFNTGLDRKKHQGISGGDYDKKIIRIYPEEMEEGTEYIKEYKKHEKLFTVVSVNELDSMVIKKLESIMDRIDNCGEVFNNYMII